MKTSFCRVLLVLLGVCGLLAHTNAQGLLVSEDGARLPRVIIIHPPWHPPVRPMPVVRPEPVFSYKISSLDVAAQINDRMAVVNLSQTFVNTGASQMEVSFLFPVPYDAAVESFTLLVDGKEFPATLLKAEEAKKTYEEIVRKSKDPALLEWVGSGMLRSRVFPIPKGESRTIQLKYTQLCRSFDGLTDFQFPFGASKYTDKPIDKVSVSVSIDSSADIRNVYSPTLDLKIEKPTSKNAVVKWSMEKGLPPADFRLMYDIGKDAVQTRILSYRPKASDGKQEDGFFLILAAPEVKQEENAMPKSVFFVLDNSGSMMGEKIKQAKAAAQFVLEHLADGDIFNIIVFNSSVTTFQPEPLVLDSNNRKEALAYIEKVYASGGTDIHSALLCALDQIAKTDTQRPNYILFLTDGCPTVGVCNESKITEDVQKANTKKSRIFAFGAGFDLNSRLVDRLVTQSSGQSEYIRPNENIEERVSRLYSKLHAPILSEVSMKFTQEDGKELDANRIYPAGAFDIFSGEQLAISGRYHTPGKGTLTLSGKTAEGEQTFSYPLTFVDVSDDATFAFVEKLWAIRRIGEIIDELDLKGKNDELIQELVQLSTKHGILTPYTSFLADENTKLNAASNVETARGQVESLNVVQGRVGVAQRSLKGGFRNAQNVVQAQQAQQTFDADNSRAGVAAAPPMLAAPMRQNARGPRGGAMPQMSQQAIVGSPQVDAEPVSQVAGQNVRTINNRAFFFKNGQWVDSTLTESQQSAAPVEVTTFSQEYFDLIAKYGEEIAPYLAFDEPVLLNVNQKAVLIQAK
ncbi:MAG: VIT domain-containing protein [Planctomycetia bacterium]|nr:VIT domain-containing protein [Planctomycetia bacterium]